MKTLAFRFKGKLHIVAAAASTPSMGEWKAYVDGAKALFRDGLDPTTLSTLVFTDGGGPNAAQRRMINDELGGRTTRVGVVSSNVVTRSFASALAWFNPEVRVFSPADIANALRFLNVDASTWPSVWEEIQGLRDELGVSELRTLQPNVLRLPES